jgi:hypothetical protein
MFQVPFKMLSFNIRKILISRTQNNSFQNNTVKRLILLKYVKLLYKRIAETERSWRRIYAKKLRNFDFKKNGEIVLYDEAFQTHVR